LTVFELEPARMRLFGELTKIEDQPDGTLKVYGVASTGTRDDAGEIVLPDAMKAALPDYARYPALREMHQPSAAGRTLEASVDEDGATRIVAHVVDPVAIAKVKSRTYSGFSIGGRVLARDATDATVITKIKLSEISLVDRPANPEAVIDLWKAEVVDGPPAAPGNEAVKARAAEMARAAGRPAAWKDYVAKARAALIGGQPADTPTDDSPTDTDAADDDDPDAPDEANDDPVDQGDADDQPADDNDASSNPADVATRIAELAAADPDSLQAVHDALAALGAVCDPDNCPDADKAVTAGDLAKLDGGALVEAVLAKALPRVEALEQRLQAQTALIERLAAAPLPPRTAASAHARAIGKAEDADPAASSDISADDAHKAFAALTPDERAFLLMKASLRQPIPIG
jgi:HK97 family phage prohead protease